jgi:outer membrane protein OmpA-like peptidoglycan-associated protein
LRALFGAALPICLAAAVVAPASAQDFADRLKRSAERAAQSEVERKVDRETRRITRCALGDERCRREAERRGDTVEVVDAGGRAAATAGGGGDHPLIARYAGSTLRERNDEAFTDYLRIIGFERGQVRTETLEGRLTRIRYSNPQGRATLEILRNYRDALTARGLRVDWECSGRERCGSTARHGDGRGWNGINGLNPGISGDVRYFTGQMSAQGGGKTYVAIAASPAYTDLHVLETAGMDGGMVEVNAEALAAGLESEGKVTLQGIYFDTGKDTLKPESDAALAQVAALLRAQPNLKLRVVGHTDDQGNAASNMTLSQRRAQRVRDALVQRYGIAAARLTAQGAGSLSPVSSNATEAGRAQNRRVELVKR